MSLTTKVSLKTVYVVLPEQVVLFDVYGGIINPMTGQLLAQLPALPANLHFESTYSAGYAPLMMSYENNYTVVELLIVGGSLGCTHYSFH